MDANALQPVPSADQRLTIDNTAGGVQFGAFGSACTHILVSFETAQCRVTFDDSAPTTTNGHILEAGMWLILTKRAATVAKFIRTGATSAVAHASEFMA
jgi:hypothetical protein